MKVSEIGDLVRSKLGAPDLDPVELKFILEAGRREIETRCNAYWMVGDADKTLTASTATYDVVSDWSITHFKEQRHLFIRDVGGTQWLQVPIGGYNSTFDVLPTTPNAKPEMATMNNATLHFFATPDNAYPVKFFYFKWTTNPTDITDTDEMFTNWFQLALYASLYVGKKYMTQNKDSAQEWEELMKEQVEVLKVFTNRRLGEQANQMSTREAAQILQAAAGTGAPS